MARLAQLDRLLALLDAPDDVVEEVAADGDPFGSPYRVTQAAVAAVAAAVGAVAAFERQRIGQAVFGHVDGRHAAAAFHSERFLRLARSGEPALWDPIAGNYATADGWIRLHTNLPHHRRPVVDLLGVAPERDAVAAAVARWPTAELEAAVIDAGGVAARMRTREAYERHPQRDAVLQRSVVDLEESSETGPARRSLGSGKVLDGIRVLDLSRVIAGPVSGRFLASFGADVIRLDPPLEDGLLTEIDTGSGKRRTTIDLHQADGRRRFEQLLAQADVLLEGFRPGAFTDLGYPDDRLRDAAPGLVIGHLSAYGDRGTWAGRRGFDSVVQLAIGLAHTCGFDPDTGPGKLPAQALDHASGYLMAAGLVAALTRRETARRASTVHVSLARTGEWLADFGVQSQPGQTLPRDAVADLIDTWPDTAWGQVEQLRPVGRVGGRPARWTTPPVPRTDAAVGWRP